MPAVPGKAKVVHVGFDDPPRLAADAKTEDERLASYRRVRDKIRPLWRRSQVFSRTRPAPVAVAQQMTCTDPKARFHVQKGVREMKPAKLVAVVLTGICLAVGCAKQPDIADPQTKIEGAGSTFRRPSDRQMGKRVSQAKSRRCYKLQGRRERRGRITVLKGEGRLRRYGCGTPQRSPECRVAGCGPGADHRGNRRPGVQSRGSPDQPETAASRLH